MEQKENMGMQTPPPLGGMPPAPPQFRPKQPGNKSQSLTLKIIFIVGLSLLLLIPDMIIYSLNEERESSQRHTTQEISKSWSGSQLLSGPIISIPYITKNNKDKDSTGVVRLLPNKLNATGNIKSRTLSRSIYETTVYNADVQIEGNFDMNALRSTGIPLSSLLLDKAYVTIGIGDLKGVESITDLKLGDDAYTLNGATDTDVYDNMTFSNNTEFDSKTEYEIVYIDDDDSSTSSGCMQSAIKIDSISNAAIPYSISMKIKGSESLGVTPIGRESVIKLEGECKSPSFAGMFIPTERTVENGQFSAEWLLNSTNREYPQAFIGNKSYKISRSAVVVNMLVPVDRYQKVSRAMKYAIIVILLTFISVLFAEIMTKNPIHMFQYLLIGLALILFYSLLLSLAEHMSFGFSYLIAAVMTIGLVSVYMLGVVRSKKIAFAIGGLLIIIYTFIYILLCLETFALLTGSIGLFIALAAIMYASLKIKGDNISLK